MRGFYGLEGSRQRKANIDPDNRLDYIVKSYPNNIRYIIPDIIPNAII